MPYPPPLPPALRAAGALLRRVPGGRRVALRLARGFRPGPYVARMPARLGGYRFLCDLRGGHAADAWLAGVHEPQETALLLELLGPGMTFVDVGANWGYFTLLGAGRVGPSGRVVAVEPDPRVHPVLLANVRLNGFRRVTVAAVAAADVEGTVALEGLGERGARWGLARLAPEATPSADALQVEARPLDDLLDELRVPRVHLLKMDVEGAESHALAGLERSLAGGRVDRVLVELHPHALTGMGSSAAALMDLLEAAGLRGWTVDHSAAANRHAHRARRLDARRWIRPLDRGEPLDAWPHQLWVRGVLGPLPARPAARPGARLAEGRTAGLS